MVFSIMYYCVETTYRAGGNVSYRVFSVKADTMPKDKEMEESYHVKVQKYFDNEYDAIKYSERFEEYTRL